LGLKRAFAATPHALKNQRPVAHRWKTVEKGAPHFRLERRMQWRGSQDLQNCIFEKHNSVSS
jgi:hypothetical protein